MNPLAASANVIVLNTAVDLSAQTGHFVKCTTGTVAAMTSATTETPAFLVVDGNTALLVSSLVPTTGAGGSVWRCYASGTINFGERVIVQSDGTVITDPGSGARWIVGECVQPGGAVSGDLFMLTVSLTYVAS